MTAATNGPDESGQWLLRTLQERAKELNCLYAVDEILTRTEAPAADVCRAIVEALPAGWQYPQICRARVRLEGEEFRPADFDESPWQLRAPIAVRGEPAGEVVVAYLERRPVVDEGPFLREERRLIDAIADRLGLFLLQRRLRHARDTLLSAEQSLAAGGAGAWRVILEFLRGTDPRVLARITRKMINFLCWSGVRDAERLLQEFEPAGGAAAQEPLDENRPLRRPSTDPSVSLAERTFGMAARVLGDRDLVSRVRLWIEEDKSGFLLDALEKGHSSLTEIGEAVERYRASGTREEDLPVASQRALRVNFLRRMFTDQIDFVNVAKDHVQLADFQDLLQHTIHPARSHGKLGGKSAGLFLAMKILRSSREGRPEIGEVRAPKTWYLTSDSLLDFIHHNSLEDLYGRKYLDTQVIRREYPYIIDLFKSSRFPPEIDKGLATALDDLEGRPLIVRSSSLLEDRSGAAFSGKYKSLFLANQGPKRERLAALRDAIAEVYASIFSPDPIEYRAERGLLDVHEEMGIMIQEVVGRRVGRYYLPAFAGVAFTHNEFRWSSRIRRDDGLARLVPGLGTRSVDRLSDDFPVLISPGQPKLSVNVTSDEVVRYSPRKIDVINLESNAFETVDVHDLLRECGDDYPIVRKIVSIVDQDRLRLPSALEPDWKHDALVVSFQGLIGDGRFIPQLQAIMESLRERLATPVDIEFACDGETFHLLQCRAQSQRPGQAPAAIPRDLPRDRVLFAASRHVSNGWVPDITHVVYVDPEAYSALGEVSELRDVGHAVSRLNKLLPKRRFVLMGPGRWGSRGDIRLGVSVAYSDINNTAMLIEIARQRGGYLPELSFGTHFFQDLVEADIRYLPLYPDEAGGRLNELFLQRARNILPDLLPEFAHLAPVIRVIDLPRQSEGRVLRVLLNADLDEGVGLLAEPGQAAAPTPPLPGAVASTPSDEHSRWRMRMAERIAAQLGASRFGVKALYVLGSAKNTTAGPGSDLDLIVHIAGDERQREDLLLWLDGWSRSLAEVNYLRTGYRSEGLLDVHLITDEDLELRTSFAAKIDAVTDAAHSLPLGPSRPAVGA